MTLQMDALLTLSRVSKGQKPMEKVDLNVIVDSAIERLGYDIKQFNVAIQKETLPTVTCDPTQI